MVEVKSVKVDNWGVFFLQKLQNFFNKTHYCDLTLQFKDNSQLKVHRLVLSACTDFFNVLETQYNVQDDILVMPKDLQADVVVPIVNFMYTGTLEFEVNMYPRLLKTAKDMNMTVLLKLLDAHKRTVGESLRQQQKAPVVLNKGVVGNQRVNTYSRSAPAATAATSQRTYTTQRRAAQTTSKTVGGRNSGGASSYGSVAGGVKIKSEKSPVGVMRTVPSTSYIRKNLPEPVQLVAKYAASGSVKGPSRFECTDDVNTDAFESSFDNISYESKPLITSKDDHDDATFEKIKRTASGAVKRGYSANSSITSPPEKKPNIEEIKEYTEAHRMRKEILTQEADEELDYYAEDFQNADDDDDDENDAGGDGSTGSVVIKSESGGAVNHAKIISEVLKKYPHLVKNNKNIKLKILQKGNSPVTVSAITKDPTTISTSKQQAAAKQNKAVTVQAKIPSKSEVTVSKKSATVATAGAAAAAVPATAAKSAATGTPSGQPKKIDSRTMHALIAKGAENMTGPWLCLECGVDGRPISIPTYRSFRRHLINIHKQKIDPRICEHCGHRANKRNDLHYHILIKHNIKPPNDLQFPKCGLCTFIALDQTALRKHKEEDHQSQGQQHCIYCNKTFQKEIQLYSHMRSNHKSRAIEDGVMDFSDEETYEDDTDKYVPNHPDATQAAVTVATSTASESKIKVLSNITLPAKGQFIIDSQGTGNVLVATSTENIALEPSSEAEAMSNVASGIATSLAVLDTGAQLEGAESYEEDLQSQYIEAAMADVHGEILKKEDDDDEEDGTQQVVAKFITEEGSELQLTAQQKAHLLEQLQGQDGQLSDNVVMVLDASFEHAGAESDVNNASTDDGMDVDQQSQGVEEEIIISAGEQQQRGGGDDSTEDEMASIENTSADEDSQQEAAATDIHEHDVSNDESAAAVATTGEVEKSADEEKAKELLSALEGDWSEEDSQQESATEEQQQQHQPTSVGKKTKSNVAKVEESKHTAAAVATAAAASVVARPKRSSKKVEADSIKIEKGSDNDSAKTILDDWDSQEKFDEECEKSAREEKGDLDADDADASTEQTKSADNESKNGSGCGGGGGRGANNKTDKKQQLDEKSEIRDTLINDWGDEDEEAF